MTLLVVSRLGTLFEITIYLALKSGLAIGERLPERACRFQKRALFSFGRRANRTGLFTK